MEWDKWTCISEIGTTESGAGTGERVGKKEIHWEVFFIDFRLGIRGIGISERERIENRGTLCIPHQLKGKSTQLYKPSNKVFI